MSVFAKYFNKRTGMNECPAEPWNARYAKPVRLTQAEKLFRIQELEKMDLSRKAERYACEFYNKPHAEQELLLGFFDLEFLEELYAFDQAIFVRYLDDLTYAYVPKLTGRGRSKKSFNKISDLYDMFLEKIEFLGDFIFRIYDFLIYIPYPASYDNSKLKDYLSQRIYTRDDPYEANTFIRYLFRDIIDPEFLEIINEQYFLVNALLNDNDLSRALEIISQHPEPEFLEWVFTDDGLDEGNFMYISKYSLGGMTVETFNELLALGIITKEFFLNFLVKTKVNGKFLKPALLYFYDDFTQREIYHIYTNMVINNRHQILESLYDHLLFNERWITDLRKRQDYLSKHLEYEEKKKLIAERCFPQEIRNVQEAWSAIHNEENPNTLLSRTFLNLDNQNCRLFNDLE